MTPSLTPGAPLVLVKGDDWSIPAVLTNPDGTPLSLSGSQLGGLLYLPFTASPLDLTAANGGVVDIDAADGTAIFFMPRAITATIPPSPAQLPNRPTFTAAAPAGEYPARLLVALTDTFGHRQTVRIIPALVCDPRFVDPVTLQTRQSAAFVAPAQQGPAGPAVSVNGKTGPTQTLSASDVGAYARSDIDGLVAGLQQKIAALQASLDALTAPPPTPPPPAQSFYAALPNPLLLS